MNKLLILGGIVLLTGGVLSQIPGDSVSFEENQEFQEIEGRQEPLKELSTVTDPETPEVIEKVVTKIVYQPVPTTPTVLGADVTVPLTEEEQDQAINNGAIKNIEQDGAIAQQQQQINNQQNQINNIDNRVGTIETNPQVNPPPPPVLPPPPVVPPVIPDPPVEPPIVPVPDPGYINVQKVTQPSSLISPINANEVTLTGTVIILNVSDSAVKIQEMVFRPVLPPTINFSPNAEVLVEGEYGEVSVRLPLTNGTFIIPIDFILGSPIDPDLVSRRKRLTLNFTFTGINYVNVRTGDSLAIFLDSVTNDQNLRVDINSTFSWTR